MPKSNFPKVTVIILSWNGKAYLEDNLPSVRMQDYPNYDVLIVDNGSSDDSVQFIKKLQSEDSRLKLEETGRNLLFVRGNNKGIERVIREGGDFVVFLNNDVRVSVDWLSKLISGFNQKNIGICTSKILLYYPYQPLVLIPKGEITIKNAEISELQYHPLEFREGFTRKGDFLALPKKLSAHQKYYLALPYLSDKRVGRLKFAIEGEGALKIKIGTKVYRLGEDSSHDILLEGKNIIQNAGTNFLKNRMVFEDRFIFEFDKNLRTKLVDAGCGAAMAVRTDLLKRFGVFRDKYIHYGEDSELSFRLGKAGFKTRFINDAVCYHYFWGSTGGEVTRTQSFYGTRNRLWFIKRYFGYPIFLYNWLRVFTRTVIWGIKGLFGEKKAGMFFSSYCKALVSSFRRDE